MPTNSKWRDRMWRVARMSPDELRVRAQQAVYKHRDLLVSRLPAIRQSKAALAFGGTGHFFFPSDQVPEIAAYLSSRLPDQAQKIIEYADRILLHKFDLLGYEGLDYGRDIDWHFDAVNHKTASQRPWFRVRFLDFDSVGDHKVIWELNRHQHLVTLARAFRLTDNPQYAHELFSQWYQWSEQNPYPMGINWASSLEVAFRSLAWLWVWHLMEGSAAVPSSFAPDLSMALMQSGRHIERYLSQYFAPNTHLLGEGVALFFIGTLAPNCPDVQRWRKLGWRIILEQASRQVRSDGMHFEQSTYYHVYALDLLLHARILAATNGTAIPSALDDVILRMLRALSVMSQSGPPPRFGDDDGGRLFDPRRNQPHQLVDPLCVGSVLFGRDDLKDFSDGLTEEAIWLLGVDAAKAFDDLACTQKTFVSSALDTSGIYVMSTSAPTEQQLVIDAGPQGHAWGGHGHADALSVQLSLGREPILIDPGTFTYVDTDRQREFFRATASHNTVQVDALSQAEAAGPFKWAALAHGKAERWITGQGFDFFIGSHNGYGRLRHPVIHQRAIFYLKPHFWLIRDVLSGSGLHDIDICWNFAPGLLTLMPNTAHYTSKAGTTIALPFAASCTFTGESSDGWYSPRYGCKEPSPRFLASASTQLPVECATAVVPNARSAPRFEILETPDSNRCSVRGYELQVANTSHEIFFSDRDHEPWALRNIESDARFVYRSRTSAGSYHHVVLIGGTYLQFNGSRIFSTDALVESQEWTHLPCFPSIPSTSLEHPFHELTHAL